MPPPRRQPLAGRRDLGQGRDAKAARRFFERAIGATKVTPVEVTTDQAPVYPVVLEELLSARGTAPTGTPIASSVITGRLKARLRTMRGLKQTAVPE
jgi:transposase, IS6 family